MVDGKSARVRLQSVKPLQESLTFIVTHLCMSSVPKLLIINLPIIKGEGDKVGLFDIQDLHQLT